MSCFMGYNPLVAKEVKITTWIKEFDGDSPVYPSFPNEGDCFVVFATDEDALTHNALSKKTYTNGEWADAEGGGGGGGDFPKLIIDTVQQTLSCDTTYSDCAELLANSPVIGAYPIIICFGDTPSSFANMYDHTENNYIRISRGTDELYYLSDGTITVGKPE